MTTLEKKQPREKRIFTATQKVRAVLEVWTESRRPCQVARDLEISGTLLDLWQKKSMKAMLRAMEPRAGNGSEAVLPERVEKVLEMESGQMPASRLAKRLESAQSQPDKPEVKRGRKTALKQLETATKGK